MAVTMTVSVHRRRRLSPPRTVRLRRVTLPPPVVRAYITRDGQWTMTSASRIRRIHAGAWTLRHVPSGGTVTLWSLRECVAVVSRTVTGAVTSAASMSASASERWLVLTTDMTTDPAHGSGTGQVLFDCVTGRWWRRATDRPVSAAELGRMAATMPAPVTIHS